jgi:hypothetical protein
MHGMITVAADTRQDLSSLADQIATYHHQAEAALQNFAEYAMMAGDLLIQAKLEIGHGQFGDWVAQNCKISDRTARRYMQIADHRDLIEAEMRRHEGLSQRACLRLISDTRGHNGHGESEIAVRPSLWQQDAKQTTSNDIMVAWMHAPPEERERFARSAGRDLIKAIPPEWFPAAAPSEKDARQLELPFSADVSIPDDLSIPNFLKRQVAGPTLSDTALHFATVGWRAR